MQVRNRIKKLAQLDPSQIVPNPKNWRTHPHAQREVLGGLFADIGIVNACIVRPVGDDKFMLIDGHLRTEVLADQKIPCIILDVNEQEADKILLSLDPLSAMAELDPTKLNELLATVDMSGSSLASLAENLKYQAETFVIPQSESLPEVKTEIIEDDPHEPPADPVTKPGDLWVMGEHRLLCGDSTKVEDVRRLMAGEKVSCVFTDPPYGVSIAKKNEMLNTFQPSGRCLASIADDDLSPEDLSDKLQPAFESLRINIMADDCSVFVCSPQGGELSMMMMMMQKAGLKTRHVIIWKKNQPTFSMGRLDYDYAHEPILFTWLKRHKRPMLGPHRTSVWEVDKPRKSEDHPTMKPVELYANAYLNNSDPGDAVADIYAGSGTAFVAAEQLGRRCYGMEISPAYCDVIVSRWEKLTGKKATLEKSHGTEVSDGGRTGVDVGGVPVGEAEGAS